MSAWILPGKIARPQAARAFVPRQLWPEAPWPSVVVLLAGPGQGKSQGMLAMAQAAEAQGHACWWLTCDELDQDPAGLFRHLLAAVRVQIPPFGQELEALLGGQVDPRVLWQAFWGELGAYRLEPGGWLFLDDLHQLMAQQPELVRGLAHHLDRLPEGLGLVVGTRRRPPWGLERLAGQGRALILGAAELGFSEAEAAALWAAARPGQPLPEDWAATCRAYEGWPLALAHAAAPSTPAAAVRRGTGMLSLPGSSPAPKAASGHLAAVLRYLNTELVGAQGPELQAWMWQLSLLAQPTLAACEAACLPSEGASEALEALVEAQLLQALPEGSYRFPSYLKTQLQGEAKRRFAAPWRQAFHLRAGRHYGEEGRPELALGHLIEAEAWPEAIATLRQLAGPWLARGGQAQLRRWVVAFPEAQQGEPWLQFIWGQLAWRAGEGAQAEAHMGQALAAFEARGEALGALRARLRLHTFAVTHQAPEAQRHRAAILAALPEVGEAEDRADWCLVEALAADQAGDLAAWQGANEEVLRLPVGQRVELAQCACIAHMNLFTLALHRGHFVQASAHVEALLDLSKAWSFPSEGLFALLLKAHLLGVQGELEAASQALKALPAHWEEALDWHDRASACFIWGSHHIQAGEAPKAGELLRRSVALFQKADFELGRKLPLERQAWLALQEEGPEAALALVGSVACSRQSVYDLALRLVRARALVELGRQPEAVAALAELQADAQAMAAPWPLARALLYEAAARHQGGEAALAQQKLAEAQVAIQAGGFGFLLRQDARLWQVLLGGGAAATAASAPLPEASGAASGLPAVELHLCGVFELRVGGILVEQWPRRKAKLVLAALALNPRGLAARDLAELIEDRSARLAGVQMCVTALRRQLEPSLTEGSQSRLLLYSQERYQLAPGALGQVDAVLVQAGLQAAKELRASAPRAALGKLQEALAHHRGPLLEEPFFEPHFEAEREGLKRLVLESLLWAAGQHSFFGEEAQAQEALMRALALDPCDEEVAQAAMRFYALRRIPERVRVVYWDHRKALQRRLGLSPSPELEAAHREALAQAR